MLLNNVEKLQIASTVDLGLFLGLPKLNGKLLDSMLLDGFGSVDLLIHILIHMIMKSRDKLAFLFGLIMPFLKPSTRNMTCKMERKWLVH